MIARCRNMGAVLSIDDESLRVVAPAPLPDDLRFALKMNKAQVILCLKASQKSLCSNPLHLMKHTNTPGNGTPTLAIATVYMENPTCVRAFHVDGSGQMAFLKVLKKMIENNKESIDVQFGLKEYRKWVI